MSATQRIRPQSRQASRWAADPYPDYVAEVNRSIAFSGVEQSFFTRGKARRMLEILRRSGKDPSAMNLLDIGCGVGLMHPFVASEFHEIVGVDVARDALDEAERANPNVRYLAYDGQRLPTPPASFDVAAAICVLHHVPPDQWPDFIGEARRALRPGGWLMVFEHNPWNPLTRLAVARCPFDYDAVLLSPACLTRLLREAGFDGVRAEFLFFTPTFHRIAERLEHGLRWLPAGAQYVALGRRPR
jgi:SAM-dependent methyltransferase